MAFKNWFLCWQYNSAFTWHSFIFFEIIQRIQKTIEKKEGKKENFEMSISKKVCLFIQGLLLYACVLENELSVVNKPMEICEIISSRFVKFRTVFFFLWTLDKKHKKVLYRPHTKCLPYIWYLYKMPKNNLRRLLSFVGILV